MHDPEFSAELTQLDVPSQPCAYLPDRVATMEYRSGRRIAPEQFEHLLLRGWRRFGSIMFRPRCASCTACRSLRVCVDRFAPTKSQRQSLQKNNDVRVVVQPVSVTDQHVTLFNDYHEDMHRRRGWRLDSITADEYWWSFASGDHSFAHEMLYFRDEQLIGVGLVDLLPRSSSSVYFFHEPSWRVQSPGTFSLLTEIEMARSANRQHHYLGYWIEENQSMAYKSRFGPHELLREYIADHQTPDWREPVVE